MAAGVELGKALNSIIGRINRATNEIGAAKQHLGTSRADAAFQRATDELLEAHGTYGRAAERATGTADDYGAVHGILNGIEDTIGAIRGTRQLTVGGASTSELFNSANGASLLLSAARANAERLFDSVRQLAS